MKSPSYLEINNGNQHCVIIFSSFAARDYGPMSFSYKAHFEKYAALSDFIFVKDVRNQWYNRPLPGLGDNVSEIAAGLRELTKGYRQLATFGSSMGGYASILYGGMLGADHIIALSPQTLLQEPLPRYSRKIHSGSYLDLSKLRPCPTSRYTILVGEEELFDIYQVNRLFTEQGIAYGIVPTAAHNIVKLLDDRGQLDLVIEEVCGGSRTGSIETLVRQFKTKTQISTILMDAEFCSMLSAATELYYRDPAAAVPLLQSLSLLFPDWLGAMSKLGMCHFAAGNLDNAVALFQAVSSRSSTIDEFYLTYATHLARSGQAERAVEVAAKAARIESSNKSIFLAVAGILDGLNIEIVAKECRDRFSRIK